MTLCSTGPAPSLSPNRLSYLVATGPAAKTCLCGACLPTPLLATPDGHTALNSTLYSPQPPGQTLPDKLARVPSSSLHGSQAATSLPSPIITSGHPPRSQLIMSGYLTANAVPTKKTTASSSGGLCLSCGLGGSNSRDVYSEKQTQEAPEKQELKSARRGPRTQASPSNSLWLCARTKASWQCCPTPTPHGC